MSLPITFKMLIEDLNSDGYINTSKIIDIDYLYSNEIQFIELGVKLKAFVGNISWVINIEAPAAILGVNLDSDNGYFDSGPRHDNDSYISWDPDTISLEVLTANGGGLGISVDDPSPASMKSLVDALRKLKEFMIEYDKLVNDM
jgi:hypothetical protein